MSLPDTIFIFALALVIFGPKKLPEIGRQIGKLVFEFRRASNEFKMQIEEELRAAELADRQKKLAAESAAAVTASAVSMAADTVPAVTVKDAMVVRPPATGITVSTESPSRVIPQSEETATLEAVSPPGLPLMGENLEESYRLSIENASGENASGPAASASPLETTKTEATKAEAVTEVVPEGMPEMINDPRTAGVAAMNGQSTEAHAGNSHALSGEEAAAATVSTEDSANSVLEASSREEAARRAEEHIREQIAIHHG